MRKLLSLFTAVAVCLGGLLVAAGPAQAAYSDPLTTIGSMGLTYRATPAAALTALDNALPNVSMNDLAHDTAHSMTGCTAAQNGALPLAPTATGSVCWDADREGSTAWTPQSVTTSGDADGDGMWGADRIVLTGWHGTKDLSADRNDDARITVTNNNSSSPGSFALAYLAVPNSTGSTFSAAKAHMGGMVWYGDKIYATAVGSTGVAIRVFSTKHILRMNSSASRIGNSGGAYAAYGYQYALMQIGEYDYSGGTCSMSSDTAVSCFSSISLDRSTSPDSLVTTEYFSDQTTHGRVYRFDMGSDYLLATSGSSATSSQAYRTGVANMQGVLSYNGHWYVAHSSATINGQLWDLTTTSGTSATCSGSSHACWALHPEALSLDVSTGLVWGVTEYAPSQCTSAGQTCGRTLFTVPLSSLP